MSNIHINAHCSIRLSADAKRGCDVEWVDITAHAEAGDSVTICMFFEKPGLAKRYADAINAVEYLVATEAEEVALASCVDLADDEMPF
jgi:hypothetical protein